MVIIEKIHIHNIPSLHIVKQNLQEEALPMVLFIHGFTSAKENNLHYAFLLAENGYRVILPEALYHGERSNVVLEKELSNYFWDIILHAIDEIELIKDHFIQKKLVDPERIGLAGTSMGGIITLGALTQYHWVKAAVCLMGMPYYEKFALSQIEQLTTNGVPLPITKEELNSLLTRLSMVDLSKQPEKLMQRPLLFWHGKKDPVVPYQYTYDFYQTIKPLYKNEPYKLKFISDEAADHKVTREGIIGTVNWFKEHL